MKRISTTPTVLPSTNMGAVGKAWDEVSASFDRFCLAAGIDALGAMLRHIRVASKQELKDRIMAAMDEFNRHPVVHTWSYKLDKAA